MFSSFCGVFPPWLISVHKSDIPECEIGKIQVQSTVIGWYVPALGYHCVNLQISRTTKVHIHIGHASTPTDSWELGKASRLQGKTSFSFVCFWNLYPMFTDAVDFFFLPSKYSSLFCIYPFKWTGERSNYFCWLILFSPREATEQNCYWLSTGRCSSYSWCHLILRFDE